MDMDDLLIKYLLGEASPGEIDRVEQWLAADAANRARYEQFATIWTIGRKTAANARQDAGAALQRFHQRNAAGTAPHRPGRNGLNGTSRARIPLRSIRSLRLWRIAAIFAGTLFIGGGTWYMLTRPKTVPTLPAAASTSRSNNPVITPTAPASTAATAPRATWQQVTTGNTTESVSLPDSSIVTLNRHSSISYPSRNNGHGLTLHLKGEAFFSVTHDPSRPFIVEVNDVTVKVLGTSFEVRSVTGAGPGSTSPTATELVVETGAVHITRGKDSLILHAGEKITVLKKEKLRSQPVRDDLYGYYLNRPLVCDSIPLQRAIEVLNQSYDAHIVLGRRELDSLPLTTVFRHQPLDQILAVIVATFDLSVVRQGQSIILK